MDRIKFTIMTMLKREFPNITITDTPIDNQIESKQIKLPKMLVKEKIDDINIKVVDYDSYTRFSVDEVPMLTEDYLLNKTIVVNEGKYRVIKWDSKEGVVTTDTKIYSDLFEYNDVVEILDESNDLSTTIEKDFMFCYSPFGYNKTIDGRLVEYYNRYHIDIFINDDLHNDTIAMYRSRIGKLFNRNFLILDEKGNKTKETVYMVTQLSFNMSEYNISNKIIRGSMLLKTYSYE